MHRFGLRRRVAEDAKNALTDLLASYGPRREISGRLRRECQPFFARAFGDDRDDGHRTRVATQPAQPLKCGRIVVECDRDDQVGCVVRESCWIGRSPLEALDIESRQEVVTLKRRASVTDEENPPPHTRALLCRREHPSILRTAATSGGRNLYLLEPVHRSRNLH